MGQYRYKLIIFSIILSGIPLAAIGQNKTSQELEYKLKAAFLYNFIKFVDWPEEKDAGDKGKIIIGIIGKNDYKDAFEPVKDKKIKNLETVVKYFNSINELEKNKSELNKASEDMKKCHLLFVCSSEKNNLEDIINIVKNNNVLMVGETEDFLKAGGIINFLLEDNKVRFEINLVAARQSKLTIRSQLLRLATKVINNEKK